MQQSKIILTGLLSCFMTKAALSSTPLWSIVPILAGGNNVQIATHEIKTINYKITNQSSKAHTLTFEAIKGITPITVGTGVCSNPFTLPTKNSSCILSLQITGSQLEELFLKAREYVKLPTMEIQTHFSVTSLVKNSLHISTLSLTIGDNFGGGIVGCLGGAPYLNLVVASSDNSTNIPWLPSVFLSFPTIPSTVDGASNTAAYVSSMRTIGAAMGYTQAQIDSLIPFSSGGTCSTSTEGGYNDWFLPAIDQLQCLYNNRVAIGNFDLFKTY